MSSKTLPATGQPTGEDGGYGVLAVRGCRTRPGPQLWIGAGAGLSTETDQRSDLVSGVLPVKDYWLVSNGNFP